MCVWLWFRQAPKPQPLREGIRPQSWARVVLKALRFLRKRRRIALAWGNYKNHRLRRLPANVAEGEPGRPRSSSTEEIRPLQEGPAIEHGAFRRRT